MKLSPLQEVMKLYFEEIDINYYLEEFIVDLYDYDKSMITASPWGVVNDEYLEELLIFIGIEIESFENKVMILNDGKLRVKVVEYTCKKYGKVIDFNDLELIEIIKINQGVEVLKTS